MEPSSVASCLRATICFYQRLPGDVNSHLPRTSSPCSPSSFHSLGLVFERDRGETHGGLLRSLGIPAWKKASGKAFRSEAKGKMARVSHVALPMITLFPRDSHLLFRPATTPSRYSPRLLTLVLYLETRVNLGFVKLPRGVPLKELRGVAVFVSLNHLDAAFLVRRKVSQN